MGAVQCIYTKISIGIGIEWVGAVQCIYENQYRHWNRMGGSWSVYIRKSVWGFSRNTLFWAQNIDFGEWKTS